MKYFLSVFTIFHFVHFKNTGTLFPYDLLCIFGTRAIQAKNEEGGGGRGIRTLETVARLHAFQACALDHSATPPTLARVSYYYIKCESNSSMKSKIRM